MINPWISYTPDYRSQTGGDWFSTLVSYGLGNKVVHGLNASPSCEVLCKATRYQSHERSIGFITQLAPEDEVSNLGPDISDATYSGASFHGINSTSGRIFAFESDKWEPSMQSRARVTSLLVAGINVHGIARNEAVEIVEKIAADKINPSAIDSAILPASHLKRDMIMVSKGSHRIFGKGTIQKSIAWQDANLGFGGLSQNMAFDWARVTVIARYIAEANIQTCKLFRKLAQRQGVPYYVVRNAWAYVDGNDYRLRIQNFQNVKDLDVSLFGIKSLVEVNISHEAQIMETLTRECGIKTINPEHGMVEAYKRLYKKARKRDLLRRKIKVQSSDIHYTPILEKHNFNEDVRIRNQVYAGESWAFIIKAVKARRCHDHAFIRLIANFESNLPGEEKVTFSEVTRAIYSRETWVLASSYLQDRPSNSHSSIDFLDSETNSRSRLTKLKETLFGIPISITTEVPITVSDVTRLEEITMTLLRESSVENADLGVILPYRESIKEGTVIIEQVNKNAQLFLSKTKEVNVILLNGWIAGFLELHRTEINPSIFDLIVLRAMISQLTPINLMSRSQYYASDVNPTSSFIYVAHSEIQEIKKLNPVVLQLQRYRNVDQMALEIDHFTDCGYKIRNALDWARELVDRLVGNLLIGKDFTLESSIRDEIQRELDKVDSPPYGGDMMDDEMMLQYAIQEWAELDALKMDEPTDLYSRVLMTYPSREIAEEYATYNGDINFHASVVRLGDQASYYDECEFVIKARVQKELLGGRSEKSKRKYKAAFLG